MIQPLSLPLSSSFFLLISNPFVVNSSQHSDDTHKDTLTHSQATTSFWAATIASCVGSTSILQPLLTRHCGLSVCLSVFLSVCLSVCLYVCTSVSVRVCLSVYVCLSVCLSSPALHLTRVDTTHRHFVKLPFTTSIHCLRRALMMLLYMCFTAWFTAISCRTLSLCQSRFVFLSFWGFFSSFLCFFSFVFVSFPSLFV